MAWNIENVASNWSGGSVASGSIYSGHNDNNPAYALPADPNDVNGYAGDANTGGNQRRTLTLSNGSVVWDMAGNVWQWTNDSITGTNEPYVSTGGFGWNQYTAITNWGTISQSTLGPINSAWNTAQGIGEIYSEGQTDPSSYGYVRGGSWTYGADAGIEASWLTIGPSSTGIGIGFRCAR